MNKKVELKDIISLAKQEIIPVSILVEVCYTCNEKCRHCFLSESSNKGLGLDYYDKLTLQLVDAGTMFVILTGGDPFTRDDFIDIVELFRKRRISVSIFTNGTLINESIADRLASLYINEVHISIYGGSAETHDFITRVPGSFEKSIQAIRILSSKGITVTVKSPLMNKTFPEVGSLKALVKNLGVKIQYSTVITAKDDGNKTTHNFQLDDRQLKIALADPDINTISRKLICVENYLDCIPCDTVFNAGAIDPQGNVYPCNQLRIYCGNVNRASLKDIWSKSETLCKLRQTRLADLSDCRKCDLFRFCARCPGLANLEDGNILGCSTSAKRLAKIRAELGIYPTQEHIFSSPIPTKKGGDKL